MGGAVEAWGLWVKRRDFMELALEILHFKILRSASAPVDLYGFVVWPRGKQCRFWDIVCNLVTKVEAHGGGRAPLLCEI